MTMDFENWTAYDDWLIENYDKYAITSLKDNGGAVSIEYCDKDAWQAKKNAPSGNSENA